MRERVLFLTGRLARPRLERVLGEMGETPFAWEVFDLGIKVAALATEAIITRRLEAPLAADRVVLPGLCRADLERLSAHYGVAFERGPEEVKDLPVHFGRAGAQPDLSRHDIRMFAEIVDAAALPVADIVARADTYVRAGADVIDLGCLPDTPFPHLEEAVQALKEAGRQVSVDSADREELTRGGRAGANFLLSLNEETLDIAREVPAVPVLIPARHGDLDSLLHAMDALEAEGRPYLADPVLDPIHFGFMESLERYAALRRARPEAEILMGTGNLTELTDADTIGITAALIGICSELQIRNVLCVQVSPHTRRTIEEHDAGRRLMFAARAEDSAPKGFSDALLALHAKRPFANSPKEIAEAAQEIRDANFRIETSEAGVHIYNRDGHEITQDVLSLFPKLGVDTDAAHAFYLGAELARAEIAWRLAKRYTQDRPLDWGVAADAPEEDMTKPQEAGATLKGKRERD